MEYFLNRPLTEQEIKLRNQQRCIGCGIKVRNSAFECKECIRTRTNMPPNRIKEELGITRIAINLAQGYPAAGPSKE